MNQAFQVSVLRPVSIPSFVDQYQGLWRVEHQTVIRGGVGGTGGKLGPPKVCI